MALLIRGTVWLLLVLILAFAWGQELLSDPSFEDAVPPHWSTFELGFQATQEEKVSGVQSVFMSASSDNQAYGAATEVTLVQSAAGMGLKLYGFSMINSTVSGQANSDYSFYVDLLYRDESSQWGITAPFRTGEPGGWESNCVSVILPKPIQTVYAYALFRNHAGSVFFDDFSIQQVPVPEVLLPTESHPLKLLVPLYIYPGPVWGTMKNSASAAVPIVAIINVYNGPGTTVDPVYVDGVTGLLAEPNYVQVIGYVHTLYGEKPIEDVKSDIDTWKSFYGNIQGIFLDEVSNRIDLLDYYHNISAYIRSEPLFGSQALVIINPGGNIPENYTMLADNCVIFEQSYSAFIQPPAASDPLPLAWTRLPCYNEYNTEWRYKSSAIVYEVQESQMELIVDKIITNNMGYLFVTDATLPNPYNVLPSYWNKLVQYVHDINLNLTTIGTTDEQPTQQATTTAAPTLSTTSPTEMPTETSTTTAAITTTAITTAEPATTTAEPFESSAVCFPSPLNSLALIVATGFAIAVSA